MKNNNISNRKAPSILFRVDKFLVQPKNDKITDKLVNKVFGENTRVDFDKDVALAIRHSFQHTDLCIGLAVLESEWNSYSLKTKEAIYHLPISDIHVVPTPKGIASLLFSNEYMYCVDREEAMSLIGHPNCITLKEYKHLVRGGYNFE